MSLFTSRVGQGRSMLVMHGPGLDHSYLRPWLDSLADDLEVVYYDYRGHGRSSLDIPWSEVDPERWLADADDVRRSIGASRVILFGHSLGGTLAQEYALRFPDHVERLVLCATAPSLAHAPQAVSDLRARATDAQWDVVLSFLSAQVSDDAALGAAWRTLLPLYLHRATAQTIAAIAETVQFRADAFNHAFGVCAPRLSTVGRLGAIGVPTLVLSGAHDWISPPKWGGDRLMDELPNAEHVVFEHSGHFPFIEEPDAFIAAVRRWLRRAKPLA